MQIRPYQKEALDAVRTKFQKGINRQLLSMATGTGKTVVFSQLPTYTKDILPGQMMVLAHREELIDQAVAKIKAINPTLRVDKEMAEYEANPNADCIVASVATLGRKGTKRIEKFNWERIDKLITDEAHHSTADTYQRIYDISGVMRPNSNKLLLGVTATPSRGDGKALNAIYNEIVYVYSIRQAIEDGWLVDVKGIRVNTKTNLDEVKTVAGDFAQDMLSKEVNNPYRNDLIARTWIHSAWKMQTVAFTVDIQHAKDLATMFQNYDVNAEAIWGSDPDRAHKLDMHRRGYIQVLCNCGVLTEGYDDWRISCIVLARPTKSSVLFTQMIGRGTRLQDIMCDPEIYGQKKDCLIIDVVDSTSRHSLITLPTLMGLSSGIDLQGKSLVGAVKQLEAMQQQFPHIDFSKLKDISNLEAYIEQCDLFSVKYPPEVEQYSNFTWHGAIGGGFVLMLPDKQEVRISQNMLDKWEMSAILGGKHYKGSRDTIEEAFMAADSLVAMQSSGYSVKTVDRNAKWRKDPPSKGQLDFLNKIYKGKTLPPDLTKGRASDLISAFKAKKG